jgi:hypothetical protein
VSYTPKSSDLQWARNLMKLTTDGAIWTAPRFGMYRIDHTNKTLTLIESWGPEEYGEMDVAVFGAIGYTVKKVE